MRGGDTEDWLLSHGNKAERAFEVCGGGCGQYKLMKDLLQLH
jgi:hypothetical protein